jgi:HK97 family phage major capsid protein
VLNLARSMREGATSDDIRAAAFEIEAVNAAAVKAEVSRGGYTLPAEVLNSWNDFEVGGVSSRAAMATSGNANVQSTDHLAGRFIDNLRNRLVLGQLGLTMLTGLDGNIEIPGGDANISAAWLGSEDADAAESTPSFRKISMAIHDIAVYTDMTRRMLVQSTIDIERYVRMQIVDAMAEGIDLAGFYGSGSAGQPTGLVNTSGIGTKDFAAAVPTRDELIDMKAEIAATNRGGAPVFVSDTDMEADLSKAKVDAGSGIFLINSDGRLHIGNQLVTSNQLTAGDVLAGIWSDMLMGTWGGLELARSTEAKFLSGGIRLRAIQSVDFGVQRVGSFVLGNDDQ